MEHLNQTLRKEIQTNILKTQPKADAGINLPVLFLPGITVIENPSSVKTDAATKKADTAKKKS